MIFMRIKLILCAFFLSLHIVNAFSANESPKNREKYKMSDICELPEDHSAVRDHILDRFGGEMSGSDIEILRDEFDIIKDEFVIDPFYSRKEKVRFIGLSKKCKASDGIVYELQIGATIDADGEIIFSQFYVIYTFEDILNGKRKFSFDKFHGNKSEYSKLISREAVDLLTISQFDDYMKKLGCERSKNITDDKLSVVYLCKVNVENDLSSRLAVYDFSKKIWVDFSENGIVKNVKVTW